MAQNKILPWAQTGTANVLSDADYAADVATGGLYGDGVKTGQASSKQANKTWRQATAPGAGLGQFIVDNLGVDVTDADTPSTFSSRIANAVLKLAQISPFNQSWATATGGYRKYAIVSDSSGNFWVSTADQNTTVPGANGAKWQSLFDGYATQDWVNTAFQPVGDYATNPALNTEITNRTNADSNLQNQINNRVQKTGDTIDWLTTTGGSVTTIGYSGNDGVPGGIAYASGLISAPRANNTAFAIYRFINQQGVGPFASIWLTDNQGNVHELRFGDDDRLRTASGNVFALTSELPVFPGNLSGNGWQKLPSGFIVQWDTVTVPASTDPANNYATVNFPTSFPRGCFGIVGVDFGGDCNPIGANPINNGQAQIRSFKRNTNSASNVTIVHYLAWGF